MDDSEDAKIPTSEQSNDGIPPAEQKKILRSFRMEDPDLTNLSLGEIVEHFLNKETP